MMHCIFDILPLITNTSAKKKHSLYYQLAEIRTKTSHLIKLNINKLFGGS